MTFSDVKSLAIPEGEVRAITVDGVTMWTRSYVNLVPLAIDTTGEVYNGVGYMEDYRLNSSGTTSTLSGACHTGFIPFSGTDILRAKGSKQAASSLGQYIAFYNEDFTVNQVITISAISSRPHSTYVQQADERYLLTIDIAQAVKDLTAGLQSLASAKYLRVSFAGCAGTDMVVTLNEPIA